jgi:hypothetical protein
MLVALSPLWLATVWLALSWSTWGSLVWYDSKVGLGQCLTRPKGTLLPISRTPIDASLRLSGLSAGNQGAFFHNLFYSFYCTVIRSNLKLDRVLSSSPATPSGVSKLKYKSTSPPFWHPPCVQPYFLFTSTLPARLHSLTKTSNLF